MARFGRPEDLLGAVLWLLAPASAFVTGVVLPIDGGFAAYTATDEYLFDLTDEGARQVADADPYRVVVND